MAEGAKKAYLANGTDVEMTVGGTSLKEVLKSLPDFSLAKEQVETTVLSSMQKTYIAGLKDAGELEFGCNYDKTIFTTLNGFGDEVKEVAITLSDGTSITFNAQISVSIAAMSSGSLMEMNVKLTVTDEIQFA